MRHQGIRRVAAGAVVAVLGAGALASIAAALLSNWLAEGLRSQGYRVSATHRDLNRHEVRVRGWPGDTPMELVALTHAHGAWIEALARPYETRPYSMRLAVGG